MGITKNIFLFSSTLFSAFCFIYTLFGGMDKQYKIYDGFYSILFLTTTLVLGVLYYLNKMQESGDEFSEDDINV